MVDERQHPLVGYTKGEKVFVFLVVIVRAPYLVVKEVVLVVPGLLQPKTYISARLHWVEHIIGLSQTV